MKKSESKNQYTVSNLQEWPGAFGSYKYSREAVLINLTPLLLILAISILSNFTEYVLPEIVDFMLTIVLAVIIPITSYKLYLAGVRRKQVDLINAVKQSFSLFLIVNFIGLAIISTVILVVAFLLFIIPGIIVLPRIVLAPYFIIDKKIDCIKALSESWNQTKGYSSLIWGVLGANIAMALLFFTIVGIPFAFYFLFMYSAIFAVVYDFVQKSKRNTSS